MQYVAFFRNMNLGHRGSPNREQLFAAFVHAGARSAQSFQTNGTVIFDAEDPQVVADKAKALLATSGYCDSVMIRDVKQIDDIANAIPTHGPNSGHYREMVSFYDFPQVPAVGLPFRSADELVEVLVLEQEYAFALCWKPRGKAGDVTGCLEALLDTKVTSRSLGTIRRLRSKLVDM